METGQEFRAANAAQGELPYRPVFYRLPQQQAEFDRLVHHTPGLELHDHIEAQLREFVKAKEPGTKRSGKELQKAIQKHLDNKPLAHYGCWVFYPWSSRLVHLLDEQEFVRVRTDRNRNKITGSEHEILAKKKVGVIGLSVGQSVSLAMASERSFGEIRLADFDTLDLSNLNRIRAGTHELGVNKAIITAREIAELDPYLKVICFPDGLTMENMDAFFTEGGKLDVLVEECDSIEIKILARQKARALGIPVVMDTSDRGCLDVERFDLEPDRPILHGLIDHLDLEAAKRPMSPEEKVPYMLPVTGVTTLSPRMKASLVELGSTISTWPQLATGVALGGALAGDAVRRISLGQFKASGRWHVDMEELIADPILARPHQEPSAAAISAAEWEQIDQIIGTTATETPGDVVRQQLVEAGAMAPSQLNSQPWAFAWRKGNLLLFTSEHRPKGVWDPADRNMQLAMGACVENISVAAGALGWKASFTPSETGPAGFFGWINLAPSKVNESAERLAQGIPTRSTDRSIGDGLPLEPALIEGLEHAAAGSEGSFYWLHDRELIAQASHLARQADRLCLMDQHGHREFFGRWLKWDTDNASVHGLPAAQLGLPPMAQAVLQVLADARAMDLLRQWDGAQGIGALTTMACPSSSAMLLATIKTGAPGGIVGCGRVMQRLWLTAQLAGIGVQPVMGILNLARWQQPTATNNVGQPLLEQLMQLFGPAAGTPVFLLRFSRPAHPTLPAPKRPWQDLMLHQGPITSHENHTPANRGNSRAGAHQAPGLLGPGPA